MPCSLSSRHTLIALPLNIIFGVLSGNLADDCRVHRHTCVNEIENGDGSLDGGCSSGV